MEHEYSSNGADAMKVRASTGHGTVVHDGMPPLPPDPLYPAFRRKLPDPVFYAVPALMWALLSVSYRSVTLPSVANPQMEVGGLWGERKSEDLSLFGERANALVAPYVTVRPEGVDADADLEAALATLEEAGLTFPIVAKPDRGYQGWGVRKVDEPRELRDYLSYALPDSSVLLQKFAVYQGEAGIFYIRQPHEAQGKIVSMAFTYAPHVVGDGESTLESLVAADPVLRHNRDVYKSRHPDRWQAAIGAGEVVVLTNARSAKLGAVYRDAGHLVTPRLERVIEEIAQDIPDFHFGRFDIRFRTVEDLKNGEAISILELNGAGAEMLHIWDGRTRLIEAYATLWKQYRTLFSIGAAMRRRGHRPAGVRKMAALQRRQEHLRRGYPPRA